MMRRLKRDIAMASSGIPDLYSAKLGSGSIKPVAHISGAAIL